MEETTLYVVTDDPEWSPSYDCYGPFEDYPSAVAKANALTARPGQQFYVIETRFRPAYRVTGAFQRTEEHLDASL